MLIDEGAESLDPVPKGPYATAVKLVVLAVLVVAIALRFLTKSPLWLDEALTVDISREPLSKIPGLLKHDGAPPLYYFLLHFWMEVFGQGDVATRALAGLFGVINLPVGWVAGYRVGSRWWSLEDAGDAERRARESRGRATGWAATLLLASSPFAVYYDTEARMYGFVLLLGTLGIVAATSILRRPRWTGALALGLVASALLYTHYWSLYVCGVAGIAALWCAWRGPQKKAARYALAGLIGAALSFLPWVPTLIFQLKHTGTPWATAADYTAIVFAFTEFAGGDSSPGRALALIFFFLLVLALFGIALDKRHVLLDLHTRPGVRAITVGVVATLLIAVIAGKLSGSTFADRYTSVIAFPAILAFAYGVSALKDWRWRSGMLGVAVVFGFAASIPNVSLLRTQAGQVAAAITAGYHKGDVIGYCPDQLGPSVSRLLPAGDEQLTFPRDAPPQIVDWVNYLATIHAASPFKFAVRLDKMARHHTIWYVDATTYQGFGRDCQEIADYLGRNKTARTVVSLAPADTPFEIYEGMTLQEFTPK